MDWLIKRILDYGGTFILEVEYLINFIKNLEFERFYFDRPFYYSLYSIYKLFKVVDMSITDINLIDIHGESLRIFIKNKKNLPMSNRAKNILKKENKKLNYNFFNKFNLQIIKESNLFKSKLIRLKKLGKKIIGYGAPARLSTITNFANINYKHIEFIVDDNPLKQNRFSPGKHIPIKNNNYIKNKKVDILVVFAYDYFKDIKYS